MNLVKTYKDSLNALHTRRRELLVELREIEQVLGLRQGQGKGRRGFAIQAIMDVLSAAEKPLTHHELVKRLPVPPNPGFTSSLGYLARTGQIRRTGRSGEYLYSLPKPGTR